MKFIHISDVHLPTTKARLTELFSKRLLSCLSWHHKRKNVHLLAVTQELIKDIQHHEPEHFCVTGDLMNASLRSEFEQAQHWLKNLAPKERISFVPGNHDVLVKQAEKQKSFYFSEWMQSDDKSLKKPYIQRKGNIAFIGLDSAIATPPCCAYGKLGEAQLARLAKLLTKAKEEGLFRVVLIHHPPLPGMAKWRKALRDAAQLEVVLQECGAELVLHGHNHYPMHKTLETVNGTTHIYGVGSSSMVRQHKNKTSAHYYIFNVTADGFEVRQRMYDAENQKFSDYNPS